MTIVCMFSTIVSMYPTIVCMSPTIVCMSSIIVCMPSTIVCISPYISVKLWQVERVKVFRPFLESINHPLHTRKE